MHFMPKLPDLDSMENRVCFNLRKFSRVFTQFYAGAISRHALLPTQTPILYALASHPDAGMAELSEALGMDRTTLVRNLRPLERDGLVKMSGKGSGGKVALSITAGGKKALAEVQADWHKAQQAVVESLGEERWRAILRDLEKAASALSH